MHDGFALQQGSSRLLNLLLFIPEKSSIERQNASFPPFPPHPDAGLRAGVGTPPTWRPPCACCAAGDGCAASGAAPALSL